MHPTVNRDVVFYKSQTEVWAATITNIPQPLTDRLEVGLAIFPPPTVGSSIQGRDRVPYGPGKPGCWGWDTHDQYPAAENLSGHRVVTLNENLELIYADCTIATHAHKVFGLIVDAAAKSDTLSVYSGEIISEPSWNWEPGRSLFLYVDGTMTQNYRAVCDSGGFTLIVAEAIAPSSIFFAPKMPTMRI